MLPPVDTSGASAWALEDEADMVVRDPFDVAHIPLTARGLETPTRPASAVPGTNEYMNRKRRVHSARLTRDRHQVQASTSLASPAGTPKGDPKAPASPVPTQGKTPAHARPKSALSVFTTRENEKFRRNISGLATADHGGVQSVGAATRGGRRRFGSSRADSFRDIDEAFEKTLSHINHVLDLPSTRPNVGAEPAAAGGGGGSRPQTAPPARAGGTRPASASRGGGGGGGNGGAGGDDEKEDKKASVIRKSYHQMRREVENRLRSYRDNPGLQDALHQRCKDHRRVEIQLAMERGDMSRRNFLEENMEHAVFMEPGYEGLVRVTSARGQAKREHEARVASMRRQRERETLRRKSMMTDRPKQMRRERLQRERDREDEQHQKDCIKQLLMLVHFGSRIQVLRGTAVRVSAGGSAVTYKDGLLGERLERPRKERERWAAIIIYRWWARIKRRRAGAGHVHRMFIARPVARRWIGKVRPKIARRHAQNIYNFLADMGKASHVVRMMKAFRANMIIVQSQWRDQVNIRRAKAHTVMLQWTRYEENLRNPPKPKKGRGNKGSTEMAGGRSGGKSQGSTEVAGGRTGGKSQGSTEVAGGRTGGKPGRAGASGEGSQRNADSGGGGSDEPSVTQHRSGGHRNQQPVPRDVKLRVVQAFMRERRTKLRQEFEEYKLEMKSFEAQREINEMKKEFFKGTKLEGTVDLRPPRRPRMPLVLAPEQLAALHQRGINLNLEEMVARLGMSMESITGGRGAGGGGGLSTLPEGSETTASYRGPESLPSVPATHRDSTHRSKGEEGGSSARRGGGKSQRRSNREHHAPIHYK